MRYWRIFGNIWDCYYFFFEKKIVKCFVQCHAFAQPPPDRRPNDKYPVNTSHRYRFVLNHSFALLFGSNGNSYTISTQSEIFICTHIIQTMENLVEQKKLKYGTALNFARHRIAKSGVVSIADRYGSTEKRIRRHIAVTI